MILRRKSARTPSKYPSVNGVMTLPDGREICDESKAGRKEYEDRTWEMAKRQGYACAICGRAFTQFDRPTFEHQDGKGMGNSRQDDRIEIDGKWHNAAAHLLCNGEKSSRRFAWNDAGEYTEVKR